ncbi:hypothetical protein UPYG_G00188750 [Umbra pygmaea]|uniref:snRNA-activating protein complex subunit 4 n=1 Tax=Umbra pygmaea TaxID=75934 RepID=A0ABD0WT21_UMBPY
MSAEELRAQREKIQRQILALERTLGSESNSIEQLFSDSCPSEDGSDGNGSQSEDVVTPENLEAERQKIQREIEELELTLGPDAFNADNLSDDGQGGVTDSNQEDSADELDLPQDTETCLQINLVYQEVLKDKLEELEQLLMENQQQQNEIMTQLSSTGTPQATTPGQPTLKLFLGSFMKPYFRDKLTSMGPPPNPETREIMNKRVRPLNKLNMKKWVGWQKTLLINAVVNDSMKRMIQPKLSKVEYLTQKMTKAENMERQMLQKQISEIQREIETISELKENELMGGRYDDHDWQKISNIDFEGLRESEEIQSFWQNYLHPSINKTSWKDNEIEMLKEVAQKHMHCNWNQIADELGTNRTAFMCLQTYQRYICTDFRGRKWNSKEDQSLRELVEKMRIGNFVPYTQISYFMEGRDAMQLLYRWTQVLDPTIKKGFWSKEEDEMLRRGVAKYGVGNWWKIRQEVPGRTIGQCRDRYLDVLIGNVKKGPFDEEEIALLRRLVEKHGYKWSKIASEMPNRLDCQVSSQWRRMTSYKYNKRWKVKTKAFPKRAKVKRQVENDDVDSNLDEDEEENIEFMDSESEMTGSDEEDEWIEVYNQPDMEQWLPVPDKVLEGPGTLRTLMVERPSQDCSVDDQEKAAKNNQQPACTFTGVRSTILDRSGNPVSTIIGKDPPILSKKDYKSDMAIFKACFDEVRSFIQWKKSNWLKRKTNVRKRNVKATSTSPSRPKVSSSNTEACALLNFKLQLAVLPWVGNVLIPPPLSSKKLCEADMVRENASGIRLGNTPVFLLFLQVLRIDSQGCKQIIQMRNKQVLRVDSQGCKQIIQMRNKQAALLDTQQALPIKPRQQYDPNTVTGILYRKENEQNRSCQQQNSQHVTAPQTLVVAQPVVQSMSQPVVQSMSQPVVQSMSQPVVQSMSQP